MKKNTFPGKFIVFEGPDGSGQSTQSELLKDYLSENGYGVMLTKEPTFESEPGKEARRMMEKEIEFDPKRNQELITQDREYHLEKTVIPALKEGKIVISDRYFFSTFAYGAASGLDMAWLIEINDDYIYPDLVFLLKVAPDVCVERILKRGKKISVFEKEEKLEKILDAYEKLPGRFENIYIVNGERKIPKVFEQIKAIIDKKLLKK
ncbi:MAG: dTMP kinase [Candidatus Nealsonbacteria bacterium]|nr:dTMP kinase [Candidatus Nealsonbacteria bacterium]